MTVRAVLLRYGGEHHATAADALRRKVLERAFPGRDWDVLVVDNALEPSFSGRTAEGWELIGGDNSLLEFSGWEKGLARGADAWDGQDPVLLVNDTFHRNYDVSYLERFGLEPVAAWAREPALIGHVDLYPREIRLFGLPLRFWVRSSFVLASWATLRTLLPLAPPAAPEEIFSARPEAFFAPGDQLSPLYREYLESFLLGGEGEYRCRWHTRPDQSPEGLARLKRKAYAIICEHWLSARAGSLGLALRDVSGGLTRRVADMDAMAKAGGAQP